MRTIAVALALVAAVAFAADTARKEDAHLRYEAPTKWVRVPAPSDMRAAQYKVPKAGSDVEDAELVMFFFGPGQGGTPEANLERWYGQFSRPDGKPVKDAAVVTIRTINGLKVTSVDLGGTYKPAPMGGGAGAPKEKWRMLAAVIEGPGGPWFFRLTGPEATVADAKPEFDAMLASVAPH